MVGAAVGSGVVVGAVVGLGDWVGAAAVGGTAAGAVGAAAQPVAKTTKTNMVHAESLYEFCINVYHVAKSKLFNRERAFHAARILFGEGTQIGVTSRRRRIEHDRILITTLNQFGMRDDPWIIFF